MIGALFLEMAHVNRNLEENEKSVNLLVAFICLFSYISYVNKNRNIESEGIR